jgi:raffinose/stachyose/melibiose transport system substrate-binding protein
MKAFRDVHTLDDQERHMTRRIRLLGALLAVAMLAAACGGDASTETTAGEPDEAPETTAADTATTEASTETTAAGDEPVTLTFWWEGAAVGNLQIFEESFARYQEMHPNVTIEVTAIAFEDMLRTFPLALDGGTGPDISMSLPLQSTTFPAAQAGHLLDLTDIGAQRGWFDGYDTKALDVNNRGLDGIYGVPYEWTTVGVYYNKDVFTELGLEPATTFAEFEALLASLLDSGVTPIGVGGLDGWPLEHVWQAMVHGNVDYEVIRALEDLDPTATYEDPALLEAAQKLLEWVEAGYIDSNVVSTSFVDANNLFLNGDVAMNVGGTWVQSDFRQASFEVGFFAMPMMNPDAPVRMGGFTPANDIVIIKDSSNVDAAVDLLDYLISEENMTAWWESGLLVPYRFDPVPEGKDQLQVDLYDAMASSLPGHFIGVSAPETARVTWAGLQEIVGGSRTPEEVFAEIQSTYLTAASG